MQGSTCHHECSSKADISGSDSGRMSKLGVIVETSDCDVVTRDVSGKSHFLTKNYVSDYQEVGLVEGS